MESQQFDEFDANQTVCNVASSFLHLFCFLVGHSLSGVMNEEREREGERN